MLWGCAHLTLHIIKTHTMVTTTLRRHSLGDITGYQRHTDGFVIA